MERKLITPQFMEAIKNFPLYSQEEKGKDAICVAVFTIGRIRWYILEGQHEGDDFVLFAVVCGMCLIIIRLYINGIRIIKMDKKTYYVAVDINRTWRSITSGTKNIAQTYICIHGDLRKKSTLELQKANALEKKMSKCPRNVVARRKQTHFQNKV